MKFSFLFMISRKSRYLLLGMFFLYSCCGKDDDPGIIEDGPETTPYNFVVPDGFPDNSALMPPDNPLTNEGVALGRLLFYEKKLSLDGSMSCASCHNQANSFTDNGKAVSTGIDGIAGKRNAMALINTAWSQSLFWDGRRITLEEQAHDPVVDPIELHNTWPNVVSTLQADPDYPSLFNKAFGTSVIDSVNVLKALAQFERTLISAGSKFDLNRLGTYILSPLEEIGKRIFTSDRYPVRDTNGNVTIFGNGGNCHHCHMGYENPLVTDEKFHNNGLDLFPTDSGLARVTKNPADMGKFKTPTLRNLSFTAPYMHDGRFKTLEEVIDFYSERLQHSATIDPLMLNVEQGGLHLNPGEKQALLAFLKTFDDASFTTNENYNDPTQ